MLALLEDIATAAPAVAGLIPVVLSRRTIIDETFPRERLRELSVPGTSVAP
jgi:hypothetical protein